jgi:hypothetical protein
VLVVLEPGCRSKIAARRVSRRPPRELHPGEIVRVRGRRLRVQRVRTYQEEHDSVVEHVTVVSTRAAKSRAAKRALRRDIENVVRMPAGDNSVVGQFIRYHVLVRVYDGDADAWLAHLRARGAADPAAGGDIRFVHWIRSRLRQEPGLLAAIRRMVDATPFWRAAAQR